ncbi:MAG: GNAT family N-acetyltransferase [Bacteroidota bacterium]
MQNKKHLSFQIKKGSIEDAVAVSVEVPELEDPHPKEVYESRMAGKAHLILIAYDDDKKIGFKVGYDKFQDGKNFYTWMGGVIPPYRKIGVADALAKQQEAWVKSQGYQSIILKTQNCHQGMLIFAIKNHFKIIGLDQREEVEAHRILLRKKL